MVRAIPAAACVLMCSAAFSCETPHTTLARIEAGGPSDPLLAARRQMVDRQLKARGIADERVLSVMGQIPRHLFVPSSLRIQAYRDSPLPIGHQQTISQPYVVAFMTGALRLEGGEKVLEIGTGSGYQAAVLGLMAKEVYTIEIVPELAAEAAATLKRLGYANVQVRSGDGYQGWPEKAPFDAIMVTAAPEHIPQPLVDQLAPGGRMVLPVGGQGLWEEQHLIAIERTKTGVSRRRILPVRFVPMTGQALEKR